MAAEQKHVVVAGGGVGALEAVLALRDLVGDAVSIELVAPAEDFVFEPMTVAAPFDRGGAARIPLAEFALEERLTLRKDAVASVEPDERLVVTGSGERVPYDVLVVAVGARKADALDGAVMFPGVGADEKLRDVLADLEAGTARSLAYVIPAGTTWALPMYELALLTAGQLERRGATGAAIHLVTAEETPLEIFGREASDGVSRLLAEQGVSVHPGLTASAFGSGALRFATGETIEVDRVVALRSLRGPALPGLPADGDGFIPVDAHCRVEGLDAVYAVGDATTFPLKQGGLAAQQADAAVEALASELGLHAEPEPFQPVLRAQLLTGGQPYYMRAQLFGGTVGDSDIAGTPLWWPPTKVAGRFLAPYLARRSHGGTAVSKNRLVDQQPDTADEATTPDLEEIARLADALATVDVSWVTPTSLRPRHTP